MSMKGIVQVLRRDDTSNQVSLYSPVPGKVLPIMNSVCLTVPGKKGELTLVRYYR
jgi:hypothetical protein